MMRMRRVLGILLLLLCATVATQARSYTLVQSENNVAFFTNETGEEIAKLAIVFSGSVQILNIVGFAADMSVLSVQGPTVILSGVVAPSGVVQVEWALDGPSVQAAAWRSASAVNFTIDVQSPTARMVIIPQQNQPLPSPVLFHLINGFILNGFISYEYQFQSIGSSDPDGTIVDYSWEWSDGVTDHGPVVYRTFEPDFFATYSITVTLTVTDDTGRTDSVSRIIYIRPIVRIIAI